jgi:hypothetical protein
VLVGRADDDVHGTIRKRQRENASRVRRINHEQRTMRICCRSDRLKVLNDPIVRSNVTRRDNRRSGRHSICERLEGDRPQTNARAPLGYSKGKREGLEFIRWKQHLVGRTKRCSDHPYT